MHKMRQANMTVKRILPHSPSHFNVSRSTLKHAIPVNLPMGLTILKTPLQSCD